MQPIIISLKEIIQPIVEKIGLELFDLQYHKEGNNKILRIVIDKPIGSVSIGECSIINKEVGVALEVKSILQERYFLEVTSPGLDRPLRDWRDYKKFKEKLIKFQTHSLMNNRRNFMGRIKEVNNDYVIISIADDGDMKFDYHQIAKAHLELEF